MREWRPTEQKTNKFQAKCWAKNAEFERRVFNRLQNIFLQKWHIPKVLTCYLSKNTEYLLNLLQFVDQQFPEISFNWNQFKRKSVPTEISLNGNQFQRKSVSTEISSNWNQFQLKSVSTEISFNWNQFQRKSVSTEISSNCYQFQLKSVPTEISSNGNQFPEVRSVWSGSSFCGNFLPVASNKAVVEVFFLFIFLFTKTSNKNTQVLCIIISLLYNNIK